MRSDLSEEEMGTFSKTFPLYSQSISYNLITPVGGRNSYDLARQDLNTLDVVSEWLSDQRFTLQKRNLEVVKQRLEKFVDQAKQEGLISR